MRRRESYPDERKGDEMSETAVEQPDATDEQPDATDEVDEVDEQAAEEHEPEEQEPEQSQTTDDGDGSSLTTWTTVGAVVGAVAGAVLGAAIGATLVRQPELVEQAREVINRDGGRVAKAATTAAGGVFAAKSVQGLAQNTGNGERTTLMKQTAREAAAAAAGATRDEIVSIRQEAKS